MNRNTAKSIRNNLTADCAKCFGLCCTALNIVQSSDFPMSKPANTPCVNLKSDYRCNIHTQLRDKGYKGCTVFDCLGAGQVVSQVTFNNVSWRENPEARDQMFRVFPIMEQIHEMIAYAAEALSYDLPSALTDTLSKKLAELQKVTAWSASKLLAFDLVTYRFSLNGLLTEASDSIRETAIAELPGAKKLKDLDRSRVNWMGKKLNGKDLRAVDFRGALLIAADMQNTDLRAASFIGADLRDADFSGANLSTSMFLTQMQMNSAKGDLKTALPFYIKRPAHWIRVGSGRSR
ncbi:hypothetical protein J41TS12_32970 [Paenibacillus antibioticophila]|uniref:Pentapeptide repeat-containing protein n=1 Tax=Paenibacillus antibioticophila TaxID=1274374 RepID=A0A919XSG0_9BACL|nr:pentapeptide repeat-containing protein [Paenibacillus antibioticophila]GIO38436.1 hypothetical protein J41TS12_32970 [Paenibacillus antibioticophila]